MARGHIFPGVEAAKAGHEFFTSNCEYGCGATMGPFSSSEGADGMCPKHPDNAPRPIEPADVPLHVKVARAMGERVEWRELHGEGDTCSRTQPGDLPRPHAGPHMGWMVHEPEDDAWAAALPYGENSIHGLFLTGEVLQRIVRSYGEVTITPMLAGKIEARSGKHRPWGKSLPEAVAVLYLEIKGAA